MYTDREKADMLRQLGYGDKIEPTREELAERVLILIARNRRSWLVNLVANLFLIAAVVLGLLGLMGFLPGFQESEPKWTSGAPGGNLIGK